MCSVFLTNPNHVVLSYEKRYIKLIRYALHQEPIQNIWNYILKHSDDNIVESIQNEEPIDIKINKGWIANAFYCVTLCIWKLLTEDSHTFSSLINIIIRLGGDTDTNGAICGCFLGAWFGFSQFDEITRNNVTVINNYIDTHDQNTDIIRPRKYIMNEAEIDALFE